MPLHPKVICSASDYFFIETQVSARQAWGGNLSLQAGRVCAPGTSAPLFPSVFKLFPPAGKDPAQSPSVFQKWMWLFEPLLASRRPALTPPMPRFKSSLTADDLHWQEENSSAKTNREAATWVKPFCIGRVQNIVLNYGEDAVQKDITPGNSTNIYKAASTGEKTIIHCRE